MQVASRRLSGLGTVVEELPQSPAFTAMSAVVDTFKLTAADASVATTTSSNPTASAATATIAIFRRSRKGRHGGIGEAFPPGRPANAGLTHAKVTNRCRSGDQA